jgi:ribosomal protein L22
MARWLTITLKCFFNVYYGVSCAKSVTELFTKFGIEKLEYVKKVIVRFAEGLESARSNNEQTLNVKPLLVDQILQKLQKRSVGILTMALRAG